MTLTRKESSRSILFLQVTATSAQNSCLQIALLPFDVEESCTAYQDGSIFFLASTVRRVRNLDLSSSSS